jgi:sugar lactone lactonase YvrE
LRQGLAKALRGGAAAGGGGGASFSSGVLGTPGYMAPELADGDYTVASEVYSFGVVLLELLTGQAAGPKTASKARRAVEDAKGCSLPIAELREAGVWARAAAEALAALASDCILAHEDKRPQSMEPVVARLQELHKLVEHAVPMAECAKCKEEVKEASGVRCRAAAGAHFCCRGCLQQHVIEGSSVESLKRSAGHIVCVGKGCGALPWKLEDLGGKLETQALVAYGVGMGRLALGEGSYYVSTLAGSGKTGWLDGVGGEATFTDPRSVCVDAAGNIIVADMRDNKIRRITPAGVVSTLAGSGEEGAADGVGGAASFCKPSAVCLDAAGNVIVADNGYTIRCITPGGVVSTLAGCEDEAMECAGCGPTWAYFTVGMCIDAAGNIIIADTHNHQIRRITPSGNVSTLAGSIEEGAVDGVGSSARFNEPAGVCMDAAGNIIVADRRNKCIRRISPECVVSTLAGGGKWVAGEWVAADRARGEPEFMDPTSVAVDAVGNIFVTEFHGNRIWRIAPDGKISTIAGSKSHGATEGVGSAASFSAPWGICVDAAGTIFVADCGNKKIRRVALVQ